MKEEIKNIAGIIYLATNKENNKKYIGATTKSINIRKEDHLQKSNNGYGHEFHNAIHTYGINCFN